MIKNYKKGFTLIELLVVVAIIGILASVVLISTSETRKTANDGAIKTNVNTVMLQLEVLNAGNDTYTANPCTTAGIGKKAYDAAVKKSGNGSAAVCSMTAALDKFAVSVPLSSKSTDMWCVDTSGNAGIITVAPTATAGVCQ